jgi:hypothetical protein
MKAIVAGAAALLVVGGPAAQTLTSAGAHGAGSSATVTRSPGAAVLDNLATGLDLNEGQKAQLRAILEEQRAQLQEYLQEQKVSGQDPSAEQILAEEQKLEEQSLEQLRAILTDAQSQRLEQLLRGNTRLLSAVSSDLHVSVHPSNPICDSTGKCVKQ